MLQDTMLHPQEHQQLFNEEMASPLNDQILNLCESELFSEIQNSEVASSSNGYCYDEQSSYSTNFDLNKFQSTSEKNDETITSMTGVSPNIDDNNNNNCNNNNDNNNSLSMIFDTQEEIDNDISASIDFTPSANFTVPDDFLQQQEEQFDINHLNNQYHPDNPHVIPLMGPPLGHVYQDESLSSVPPYMRFASSSPSPSLSCELFDPNMVNYLQGNLNNTITSEASAIFAAAANSALFFGSQLPNQELDFQGENEITRFEDLSHNKGRCSPEARKEKAFMQYACRKTLADSRPRVRGRFARNDEFSEASKANTCGTIEEDTISEDLRLNNIMYHQHHDPNMVASSTHDNNGRIFTSNCHVSRLAPDYFTGITQTSWR
ncbi:hypothetical protein RND71_040151 [Anisodus tanguticus]|uniref:CCT domain-containing protein n=1 Tax=Anisodus tanguticus TaxID=243964 RepID=A0AAE1UYH8_9SOLA|nr:hypothetical protein RND71_040151 [Anisodus tanguticus]